jgi:hypothetical protein
LKNLDQAGVIEIDRNRRKRLACGHLGMARTSRTSSRQAAIADDAVAQRCVAAPFRSPGFDAAAIRLSVHRTALRNGPAITFFLRWHMAVRLATGKVLCTALLTFAYGLAARA